MISKFKLLWNKFFDFLAKYPTEVHIFFLLYNGFISSWATKAKVPLDGLGIPITIDSSAIVSWLQLHAHMSTKVVLAVTFLTNATLAYNSWKKRHIQVVDVKPGDVLLAQAPLGKTLQEVEVKDNIAIQNVPAKPKDQL